jgi:Zn-dependent peptidase ImmA (M78 family)
MLDDLDSGAEIARRTEKLLRAADADDRLPTPVANIVSAAKLKEAEESWLSESSLAGVPDYLARKMRKLRGKAHAALDRKTHEIHISPDIDHDGQRRFKTLHEVIHDILPWQDDVAYADDGMTLSWLTRQKFEQEANQGGAELLFQRELFQTMAADYVVGFPAIIDLADRFGASIHASFRRYVETHKRPMAGVVLDRSPCQTGPVGYKRREAISSIAWTDQYDSPWDWPKVLLGQPYGFVDCITLLTGIDVPRLTISYPNLNSEPTELHVELFSNSYRIFVLLWVPRRERFKRKRILAPATANAS